MSAGSLVLDLVVKSAVVAAITLIAAILLRRSSAATRHIVLVVGVAGLLLLPVLDLMAPRWEVPALWVKHVSAPQPQPESIDGPATGLPTPQPAPTSAFDASRAVWLLWISGTALLGAKAAFGFVSLWSVRRRSRPLPEGPLRDSALSLIGARSVLLLEGEAHRPPMTWGSRRAAIMLPSMAHDWPEERVRSVVLHELAHVERNDWLTQTFGSVACALFWFNPLVWLLARKMRLESEQAADDRVLSLGLGPEEYACHLLDVAKAFRRGGVPAAMAMAHRSYIGRRLESILNTDVSRRPLSPSASFALVGALAIVATLVAAAGPRIITVHRATDGLSVVADAFRPEVRVSVERVPNTPAEPPKTLRVSCPAPPQATNPPTHRSKSVSKRPSRNDPAPMQAAAAKVESGSRLVAMMEPKDKDSADVGELVGKALTVTSAVVSDAMSSAGIASRNGADLGRASHLDLQMSMRSQRKVQVEIKKAMQEASKELQEGLNDVQVPAINVDVPAIDIKTQDPSSRMKKVVVHMPAIHVNIPAMHPFAGLDGLGERSQKRKNRRHAEEVKLTQSRHGRSAPCTTVSSTCNAEDDSSKAGDGSCDGATDEN